MAIKVGDKMVFNDSIIKVIRLTKTMFICDDNTRFKKDTLGEVGVGKWHRGDRYCRLTTPELIEKIDYKNKIKYVACFFRSNANLNKLTKEDVLTLTELIKKISFNR